MDAGGEYSGCVADEGDAFGCMMGASNKKKSRNKNKRRFSDEQIKSLETMFENETRLEPRKKVQLARELGLQPRQVAIWFQNKRARYKSKQLERDYGLLRANYNCLASRFDNLKKEKQALLIQLQKLNEIMRKTEGIDGESDNGEGTKVVEVELVEEKASLSLSAELGIGVVSDDDTSCIKAEYFGLEEEEANLMELVEPADSSLTSPEDWGNFESDDIFNQSSTSYQWWDFWS